MTDPPLVSCIMPTRNRRRFVSQAVLYFLRQDYPSKELVVVDDGEDTIEDLLPEDDRIRYLRVKPRQTIGAKRNLACRESRGELIAHWDDDDWMAPHRLRCQTAALLAADADACGAAELLYYHVGAGQAWRYRPAPNDSPWLAGCTLVYRRSAWALHPFPETSNGEDAAFVRTLDPERLLALADGRFYVCVLHGSNAGTKNLRDVRWERRPLHEVAQLIEPDREFYAELRTGRRARSGATHSSGRPRHLGRPRRDADRVTLVAPFMVYDGYGSIGEYLALGMERAGATVDVSPLTLDPAGLTEEFRALLRRARPHRGAPLLYSCAVGPALDGLTAAELFVHTMWETSRLPRHWVPHLNRARAIIVPSTFLVEAFRASGVTVPIEVVPDGMDPGLYPYMRRPPRPGVTTLIVATPVGRKHLREGVAAWRLAFDGDPNARLIVKSRFGLQPDLGSDPRISVTADNEPSRGIADWYRRADVLLALGNEGFGLPVIEAMATGLPPVVLDAEGQADVCRHALDLVIPVEPSRWEAFDEPPYGRCGVRAVPSVEAAAAGLRWVAEHEDEARDMGRRASAWAHRHRNVWDKGPAVLGIMERHLDKPRPLRRVRAVLVPSLGSPCGIAEYSAELTAALVTAADTTRLTREWPDPRGLRILHVQQEDGIVGDAELDRRIPGLARAGVPVVVTEHSVTDQARAWERDADLLVALTDRGARKLRARWPRKAVEFIPHGCHTWFPPRKRTPGRVIGAFGFLERHKGFGRLLDVVRRVHGTELLVFAHAKRSADDAWWTAAAAGLPVRRVAEFVPVEEAVRTLAAEADVLAFWYDDVPHASVSGAIRVGLATGVPVIASPTSWFEDLREVTYQPVDLIEGVGRLLEDTSLRDRLVAGAREYCHQHSWRRVAGRHEALWRELEAA